MSSNSIQQKYLKHASVQTKFKFSDRDKSIYNLYLTFQKYYQKYFNNVKNFMPKNTDPRKTRSWKSFEFLQQVVERYEQVIPEKFILAQILWCKEKSASGVCNPSFISSERAIDRYEWFLKYGERLINEDNIDNTETYIEIIKQNAIFLFKEMKIGKFKTYREMFLHKKGIYPNICSWVMFSKIDNIFLSISRTYYEIYNTLDADVKDSVPDPKTFVDLKRRMMLNPKLRSVCKQVFKNECLI